MNNHPNSFSFAWFNALSTVSGGEPPIPQERSVARGDYGEDAILLAVIADPTARYPRARHGEVGLAEGWAFADAVMRVVDDDAARAHKRAIIIVIDVPGQAYGYVEELAGIHQSLAAAANALATARLAGHPTVGLVVGHAVSGAFLAVGLQAGRLIAIDHDGVVVQVMSRRAAARITRRTIEEIDEAAKLVPATAHDVTSFARLGALHRLLRIDDPRSPAAAEVSQVRDAIDAAVVDLRTSGDRSLHTRLTSVGARDQRSASILVRERIDQQWSA